MRLIEDKVVLKSLRPEKSAGGIYIPNYIQIAYNLFEVIETGSGYVYPTGRVRPMEVKVGDRVLCNSGILKPFTIIEDGEHKEYFVIDTEEECIIILEEGEELSLWKIKKESF